MELRIINKRARLVEVLRNKRRELILRAGEAPVGNFKCGGKALFIRGSWTWIIFYLVYQDMKVIKIGDRKAEIIRNKRKGFKLIVKKVNPESTKSCCLWCSLRFDPICCNPFDSKNPRRPCEYFLPDNVFFEDETKNNTRRRRKSKTPEK